MSSPMDVTEISLDGWETKKRRKGKGKRKEKGAKGKNKGFNGKGWQYKGKGMGGNFYRNVPYGKAKGFKGGKLRREQGRRKE